MFILFFFMGVMKLLSSDKMISILLSIEVMMLSIFFNMYVFEKSWFSQSYAVVVYLTIMVCESVMGLMMYIKISRSSGKDSMKSMSVLKY